MYIVPLLLFLFCHSEFFSDLPHPCIKRFIESVVIRYHICGLIKTPQDIESQDPPLFFIKRLKRGLAFIQEVMPPKDVPLIGFQVRDPQPFPDLDLPPVFLPAFMDLDKVAESILLIIAPKGKQPAQSRSEAVH